MGREPPNLLSVAQHGRIEAHFDVADKNAVSRRADQQLGASAFRQRSNSAEMIFDLFSKPLLYFSIYVYLNISRK